MLKLWTTNWWCGKWQTRHTFSILKNTFVVTILNRRKEDRRNKNSLKRICSTVLSIWKKKKKRRMKRVWVHTKMDFAREWRKCLLVLWRDVTCLIYLFLLEEANHKGRGFWVGVSAWEHVRVPLWLTIGT